MKNNFPSYVTKYFWGDDLNQLDWHEHNAYITQTLLDKADSKAISWLFRKSDSEEILRVLPKLKMSQKSKNFWKIFLSA